MRPDLPNFCLFVFVCLFCWHRSWEVERCVYPSHPPTPFLTSTSRVWELILTRNRAVQSDFLQSIIVSTVVVVVFCCWYFVVSVVYFVVSVVVIIDTKSPFHLELLIPDIVESWVMGPCGTLWDLVGPCGMLWGLVGQQHHFHIACQTPVAYTASISSYQVSNSSLRKCQQIK